MYNKSYIYTMMDLKKKKVRGAGLENAVANGLVSKTNKRQGRITTYLSIRYNPNTLKKIR